MERNECMKIIILRKALIGAVIASFLVSAYASAQNTQGLSYLDYPLPPPDQQGPPSNREIIKTTAVYTQNGKNITKKDQAIRAYDTNQSGVKVTDGGILTLKDSTIATTGVTTSDENSNFYGLNAAILAESGSKIKIKNSTVSTSGNGANAIFATGAGSMVTVENAKIKTTADSSRGLDATLTGIVIANNVDISTQGTHSAAIATDRGNGTIIVTGGIMRTSGMDSPGIYSTGDITVTDAKISASGSEAAVVEGKNSIYLRNTVLVGTKKRGVMLYQSFSGDAEVGISRFIMNEGSLSAGDGPLFYATNTDTAIYLKGVDLTTASGILLEVGAGNWGIQGANGAVVDFKAEKQILKGNIICDGISTINVGLQNFSMLEGSINQENAAKSAALTLDLTSRWIVTGNSYLTSLINRDTTLSNIEDNGFTIYYDAAHSANNWLENKTYQLKDGGILTPKI
ncbi:hypothetical protein [Pelosinus propionicus]|nr:hypothetical protein [Pelosinus propionicus]